MDLEVRKKQKEKMSLLGTLPKDIIAHFFPVFFLDRGGTFVATRNQTQ